VHKNILLVSTFLYQSQSLLMEHYVRPSPIFAVKVGT